MPPAPRSGDRALVQDAVGDFGRVYPFSRYGQLETRRIIRCARSSKPSSYLHYNDKAGSAGLKFNQRQQPEGGTKSSQVT